MTQKAPERLWAAYTDQIYEGNRGITITDEPCKGHVEFVPIDHHKAAVAAEREACEVACQLEIDRGEKHGNLSWADSAKNCRNEIRALTPDDATEALERVKREARNEAIREAARVCERIRTQKATGPMPEGACFDYEQAIEALITEGQSGGCRGL